MYKILGAIALASLGIVGCSKYNENIAPANQHLTFNKYYGYVYSQLAADVQRTADGGYIIFGSTASFVTESHKDKYNDFYLIRTDSLGNEIWSATYGSDSTDDIARRLLLLPDDAGFVLAGDRQRIDVSTGQTIRKEKRIHLIEVDKDGVLVRQTTLPSATNSFSYEVRDIQFANNSTDYIVTGATTAIFPKIPVSAKDTTDMYAARLTPTFATRWSAIQGFSGNDIGVCVIPTASSIVVVSATQEYSSSTQYTASVMVTRLDPASGSYSNLTTGVASASDHVHPAAACYDPTTSTLSILANYGNRQGGDETDLLVMPVTLVGNSIVWNVGNYKRLSGFKNNTSYVGSRASSIQRLTDGSGYIATATAIRTRGLNSDAHLIRLDANYNVKWDWIFGANETMDYASRALPLVDTTGGRSVLTGYIMTGTFDMGSNSMIGLIKTTTSGSLDPNNKE